MSGTPSPRYFVSAGLAWLVAAVIIICIGLALVLRQPPRVIKESAPPDWFSAERAMEHVEAMAKEPHPWQSPAQEPVREYIRTVLQRYEVAPEDHIAPAPARCKSDAPVHNIVGRLPGSDPTKAVLLMAHYDSRREGPGAADDSAGVAAILETLRAIKVGPQLKNDVILLFTDAEEACLGGAQNFVDSHPWRDEVAVVLNFDGRGAAGPVYLSDAGDQNGWLIEQFAAVTPFPRGNSLMRDVQEEMPNDSDLTPFRDAGYSVMNFNWIDGYARYHKATDIPSALDRGTLQHLGEYALPLTRHFGEIDLSDTKAPNATYFNPIGNVFVFYPQWGSYIAMVVTILLFVAAVYLGRRHGHASIGRMLLSFVVFLVCGAAVCAASWGLVQVLQMLHGADIRWMQNVYLGFFASLAVFIMAILIAAARLWIRAQDLALGALLAWILIGIAVAFVAPGGLPFFTWPVILMLLALTIHFSVDDFEAVGTTSGVAFAVAALPGLMMFTPATIAFNQAMRLPLIYITMVFVVLLIGLLMPLLCVLLSRRFWPVPLVALLSANVFLIWGLAMAEPMAKWAEEEAAAYLKANAITAPAAPEEQPAEPETPAGDPDVPGEPAEEPVEAPMEEPTPAEPDAEPGDDTPTLIEPMPETPEPMPETPESEPQPAQPAPAPEPAEADETPETLEPMPEAEAPPTPAADQAQTSEAAPVPGDEEPMPETIDAPAPVEETQPTEEPASAEEASPAEAPGAEVPMPEEAGAPAAEESPEPAPDTIDPPDAAEAESGQADEPAPAAPAEGTEAPETLEPAPAEEESVSPGEE